jgi:hypothetical protein
MNNNLSIEALNSIKADMERRKASKEMEISQMPKGVRSSSVSTDIAYLQMDIQRLNQSIVEIEEIITGRMSDDG